MSEATPVVPVPAAPRPLQRGGRLSRRVLALCLMLGGTASLADSPVDFPFGKGVLLEEKPFQSSEGFVGTQKRVECAGRYCLWRITEELGPCSAERCANESLALTDRKGTMLGAVRRLDPVASNVVRFLDATHVELLTSKRGSGINTYESGVELASVARAILTVEEEGARFTEKSSPPPKWAWPGAVRVRGRKSPERPDIRPVSEELLARARALCPQEVLFIPVEQVCREGTCMLLLTGAERADIPEDDAASPHQDRSIDGPFCAIQTKGTDIREVPLSELAEAVDVLSTGYQFSGPVGVYGAPEAFEALSRIRPGYMLFADTVGLVVEGGKPYPVRRAPSVDDALALAPTVQAYTPLDISWGKEGWKDMADLAFAWRLARAGERIALHVEVRDDRVVPLGAGTGVHSDHLELVVGGGVVDERRKLGVLLGAGGKLEARVWTKVANEPLSTVQGTWRKLPQGYALRLTFPLAELQASEPLFSVPLTVAVSDADAEGKQETLMAQEAQLRFWTEYPPSVDEYRVHSGEP